MTQKKLTEHERVVLAAIDARVQKDGEHVAVPHADRARQFAPFAALTGYEAMAAQAAEDAKTDKTFEYTDQDLDIS